MLLNFTVRHVRKDEKQYYEELINFSKKTYMLYPYHLADKIVKGLNITPFHYYFSMLEFIMEKEKNYDQLPNFTAVDCKIFSLFSVLFNHFHPFVVLRKLLGKSFPFFSFAALKGQ